MDLWKCLCIFVTISEHEPGTFRGYELTCRRTSQAGVDSVCVIIFTARRGRQRFCTAGLVSWIFGAPFSQVSQSTSVCFIFLNKCCERLARIQDLSVQFKILEYAKLLEGRAFSNFQHYFWVASLHDHQIIQQTKKNLCS